MIVLSFLAASLCLFLVDRCPFVLLHSWIDDLEATLDAVWSPDHLGGQMLLRDHILDLLLLVVLRLLVQSVN